MALTGRRVGLDRAYTPWSHLGPAPEAANLLRCEAPREEEEQPQGERETPLTAERSCSGGCRTRTRAHSPSPRPRPPATGRACRPRAWGRKGTWAPLPGLPPLGLPPDSSCGSPKWVDPNALEIDLSKSVRLQRRRASSSGMRAVKVLAQRRQQRAHRSQRLHLLPE